MGNPYTEDIDLDALECALAAKSPPEAEASRIEAGRPINDEEFAGSSSFRVEFDSENPS